MIYNAQATNRALHHAWLLLQEWSERAARSGTPLHDAYAEALLHSLRSAHEALYMELSADCGYAGSLQPLGEILPLLLDQGVRSPELSELQQMATDRASWLFSMLQAQVPYQSQGEFTTIMTQGGIDPEQCQLWHQQLSDLARRLRDLSVQC